MVLLLRLPGASRTFDKTSDDAHRPIDHFQLFITPSSTRPRAGRADAVPLPGALGLQISNGRMRWAKLEETPLGVVASGK
jgi:hypothetical protein